jgi:methylase of polypeptide subunit release factors
MKSRDYITETEKQLRLSERETSKYTIDIAGKRFLVYPGVFSPKYFSDTCFFASNLSCRKYEQFLEIGCGTGIISVIAALQGARVTATDINKLALQNTKDNAEIHNVAHRIKLKLGDLYAPLKASDRFDTIFWNVPFIYTKRRKLSDLERAVFNPQYESIKRFVSGGNNYLTENGKILIGFSRTIGRLHLLKDIATKSNMSFKEINQKYIDYGPPIGKISLELYELGKVSANNLL